MELSEILPSSHFPVSQIIQENDNSVVYWSVFPSSKKRQIVKQTKGSTFPSEVIKQYEREQEITKLCPASTILQIERSTISNSECLIIYKGFSDVSLQDFMTNNKASLDEKITVALNINRCIAAVHNTRIIHQQLTPDNILIDPKTGQCKLYNLENALPFFSSYDSEQSFYNYRYISPEQTGRTNNLVDYRTDYYTLGLILYQLFIGEYPYRFQDISELIHQHIAVMPAPAAEKTNELPQSILDIIFKLLAKDPEERYQSGYGIQEDLLACKNHVLYDISMESFKPGSQDIPCNILSVFNTIAEEKETDFIQKTIDAIKENQYRHLLISGESGIGKTFFVQRLLEKWPFPHSYTLSGHFNIVNQQIALSGIVELFQNLINIILTEEKNKLDFWKAQFSVFPEEDLALVANIIPSIKLLVPVNSDENSAFSPNPNRFSDVLFEFLTMVAKNTDGIIIFLDNLHLADANSLLFITTRLVRYSGNIHLILTYQNTLPSHFLEPSPENYHVAISPFSLQELTRQIKKSFPSDSDKHADIAKLILSKTSGNLLFINHLLTSLFKTGILKFDFLNGKWSWNIRQFSMLPLSENTANLLTEKLEDLPNSLKIILCCAACLGNGFKLNHLTRTLRKPEKAIKSEIGAAIQLGILLKQTRKNKHMNKMEEHLVFSHENIQEACYNLLNESSRKLLHRRIGKTLLLHWDVDRVEKNIFYILAHYNKALELLFDEKEMHTVAELNLLAGRKARQAGTYDIAVTYFEKGMELGSRFPIPHDLQFDLLLGQYECEFLSGNHDRASELFKYAMDIATDTPEKAKIYNIQLTIYRSLEMNEKVEEVGRNALKAMGEPLPKTTFMTVVQIIFKLILLSTKIKGQNIDHLLNLPEINDPLSLAKLKLMVRIGEALYFNQMIIGLLLLKITLITLKLGNSPYSSLGYAAYGMVQIRAHKFNLAYKLGQLALALSNRYQNTPITMQINFIVYGLIFPWKINTRDLIKKLEETVTLFNTSDNILYSTSTALQIVFFQFINGTPLNTICNTLTKYGPTIKKYKFSQISYEHYHTFFFSLTNDKTSFGEKIIDESIYQEKFKNAPNYMVSFYIFQLISELLSGHLKDALRLQKKLTEYLSINRGLILEFYYHFFSALCFCWNYQELPGITKNLIQRKIKKNISYLKKCSNEAPGNFGLHYHFILYLWGMINSDSQREMQKMIEFQEEINKTDHILIKALYHESLLLYFSRKNYHDYAAIHLNYCLDAYQEWHAPSKIKQLKRTYASLLPPDTKPSESSPQNPVANIDLISLIKSSQAISTNIVLSNLLSSLLRIMMENAGAEKGYIILNKEEHLYIEASFNVKDAGPKVLQHEPLEDRKEILATKIVNYVFQTKKNIILDSSTAHLFHTDPYIKQVEPKSILCLPIIRQSQNVGILYVENSLIYQAFTSNHLKTLELLASQAAISIENARLYEENQDLIHNLEIRVAAQVQQVEKALKEKQQSLEIAEKMSQQASFATLTRGIAHEIRNPLGMILSGIEMIEDSEDKKLVREYTDIVKKNIMRLTKITTTMMKYGASVSANKELTDLNQIIRDVTLVGSAECLKHNILVEHQLKVIPKILVDPASIEQAIMNIFLNAIQAIESRGTITFRTSLDTFQTQTKNGPQEGIKIQIADTGPGIPKEHIQKIYDPFFTTKYGSTGLGLSVVLKIIHDHQGLITIDSEKDVGTIFTIYLPVVVSKKERKQEEQEGVDKDQPMLFPAGGPFSNNPRP